MVEQVGERESIEGAMRRRLRTAAHGERLAGAMRTAENLRAMCPGCRRWREGTWAEVVEMPCSCGWEGQRDAADH